MTSNKLRDLDEKGTKGGQAMPTQSTSTGMSPLIGAAAGAIAGAALGAAAVAALSNKDVREKVGQAVDSMRDTASDMMDTVKEKAQETSQVLSEKAQTKMQDMQSKAAKAIDSNKKTTQAREK